MALGDDALILQVPLSAKGKNSSDWSDVRANDLTTLNAYLRQIQERLYKLEGRTEPSEIRDDLTVLGSVTADSVLQGQALSLGAAPLVGLLPRDPSQDPTIEARLQPQALVWNNSLLASLDLLGAGSPFTACVKDEFTGGSVPTNGIAGELNWLVTNSTNFGDFGAALGHVGNLYFPPDPGPIASLTLGQTTLNDIGYAALVLQVSEPSRNAFAFGLVSFAASPALMNGIYFRSTNGANWEVVVQDGAVAITTPTAIPTVDSHWYLLEMVITGELNDLTANFYINRTRIFTHTVNNLFVVPAIVVEDTTGGTAGYIVLDTFVMAGRVPFLAKRWT